MSSPSPPPRPKKKPAFKKPTFKKPSSFGSGTDASELDFFNRSRETYSLALERETETTSPEPAPRKQKTTPPPPPSSSRKRGTEKESRSKSESKSKSIELSDREDDGGEAVPSSQQSAKRVRSSQRHPPNASRGAGDDAGASSSSAAARITRSAGPSGHSASPVPGPSSRPSDGAADTRQSRSQQAVIDLSSDDDDDNAAARSPPAPAPPAPPPAPMTAEEKYFAELEAKARRKALAAQTAQASPLGRSSSLSQSVDPPADPIVSILITSPLDNTRPMIVKRRLNQTLKEVRAAWCKAQAFTPAQSMDVFFVFRGNRVFDYVQCKSLGFEVDSGGDLVAGDGIVDPDPDGEDDCAKVHLEAVTREIMAERERELEAAQGGGAEEEEVREEVPAMRLILRAKGLKELRLKARPDTPISKLIDAFRKSNDIPADKHVRLDFDGDTLDPADTVADTELEDMMTIDVYVR